jgi:hypothetical protein
MHKCYCFIKKKIVKQISATILSSPRFLKWARKSQSAVANFCNSQNNCKKNVIECIINAIKKKLPNIMTLLFYKLFFISGGFCKGPLLIFQLLLRLCTSTIMPGHTKNSSAWTWHRRSNDSRQQTLITHALLSFIFVKMVNVIYMNLSLVQSNLFHLCLSLKSR